MITATTTHIFLSRDQADRVRPDGSVVMVHAGIETVYESDRVIMVDDNETVTIHSHKPGVSTAWSITKKDPYA